jgi:hypothetical protein
MGNLSATLEGQKGRIIKALIKRRRVWVFIAENRCPLSDVASPLAEVRRLQHFLTPRLCGRAAARKGAAGAQSIQLRSIAFVRDRQSAQGPSGAIPAVPAFARLTPACRNQRRR